MLVERRHKVDELQSTFALIKSKAEGRQSDLEETLSVAEKFWDNLNGMLLSLKELQDNVINAEPLGLEPDTIRDQLDQLEVIRLQMISSNFYTDQFDTVFQTTTGTSCSASCLKSKEPIDCILFFEQAVTLRPGGHIHLTYVKILLHESG